MKTKANALLAAMLGLAAGSGLDFGYLKKSDRKPKSRMPLTSGEEDLLASLSGKEKKQFVRTLKDKYRGQS